jgi:hypothetical protein
MSPAVVRTTRKKRRHQHVPGLINPRLRTLLAGALTSAAAILPTPGHLGLSEFQSYLHVRVQSGCNIRNGVHLCTSNRSTCFDLSHWPYFSCDLRDQSTGGKKPV